MTVTTMHRINMPGSGLCPQCMKPHLIFMPTTDSLYCAACNTGYSLTSSRLVADLLNALNALSAQQRARVPQTAKAETEEE